ncbi:hypothetical protein [Motilibacter aurantiacus]|uniref:hypothetical protein n=1 Tax=Motilibacter aurantiacus TaxID=2714955 RepID=UPI00140A2EF0|nr:hypothetical protein [Motilibacter aurantiacus]NHC44785.1 hypothetical protein [Motilibacter aurantiacus]
MAEQESGPSPEGAGRQRPRPRHSVLLRLDPAVHEALVRWAGDELRSVNAQIELLLRRALGEAGRLPGDVRPVPRRGRPRRTGDERASEQ